MKKRQKAMTKAKRKVKIIARKPTGPRIFDGMKGRFADLGEFEFHGKGDDFEVEWRHFGEERKSALFSELYSAESKAAERREVGELIANIIQREGQGVIKSIGGLNETMKVADPYWRMEHEWREWAKPLSDDTTEQSKSAAEDPIDVAVKLAEAASERAPRLVKCGLITSDNSMGAYKTYAALWFTNRAQLVEYLTKSFAVLNSPEPASEASLNRRYASVRAALKHGMNDASRDALNRSVGGCTKIFWWGTFKQLCRGEGSRGRQVVKMFRAQYKMSTATLALLSQIQANNTF